MDDMTLLRQLCHANAVAKRRFCASAEEAEAGGSGRARGHGRILDALLQGEMTQKQLAAKLDIRPQSLTEPLIKLERLGYVMRRRGDHDRREQMVTITADGVAESEKLHAARKQAALRMFASLSENEKNELGELLDRISHDDCCD